MLQSPAAATTTRRTRRVLMIRTDLTESPQAQRLTAHQFKKKFMAAIAGEVNEFTPYIKWQEGRASGGAWAATRRAVFERDDFTCQYCGARGGPLECDHIVPVSRGGGDELTNLTTACRTCNQSKGALLPEEWVH